MYFLIVDWLSKGRIMGKKLDQNWGKVSSGSLLNLILEVSSGSLTGRTSFVEDLTAEMRIWCQICHQWWQRRWLENTCQSSVTLSQIFSISGLFTAGILSILRTLSGSCSPHSSTFEFCWSFISDYGKIEWLISVQEGWSKKCGGKSRTMIISTLSTLAFCSLTSLRSNKLISWKIIRLNS